MSQGLSPSPPRSDDVEASLQGVRRRDAETRIDALDIRWTASRSRWGLGLDHESAARTSPLGGFPIRDTARWKRLDRTPRSVDFPGERIEGHFRNMFVSHSGEQEGRPIELGGDLPEDLMAWVESGA